MNLFAPFSSQRNARRDRAPAAAGPVIAWLLGLLLLAALPAAADDALWRAIEKAADHNPRKVIADAEQALQRSRQANDKAAQLKALRTLSVARGIEGKEDSPELERGILLARELGDQDALAWLLSRQAWALFHQGRSKDAAAMLDEAERVAEDAGMMRTLAWIYLDKGNMVISLDRDADGMAWLNKSYAMFESQQDRHGMALALSAIAGMFGNNKTSAEEQAQAIRHRERALDLIDENAYRTSAALFNHNLGWAYYLRKEPGTARLYLEKSYALSRALDNRVGVAYNAYWLAENALLEKRPQEALEYVGIALPLLTGIHSYLIDAHVARADALARLGRKAESRAALAAAETALKNAARPTKAVVFHGRAARILARLGDHADAYQHMIALQEAEQRRAELENRKLTDELKVRFDVELKDAANARLRAQQEAAETQRLAAFLALALAIAVAGAIIVYQRKRTAIADAHARYHKALADAKSAFLANMSHELRTPLNAMLGFARLMKRDPALSQASRDDLGIVLRSGEHLYTLINEVLDLSKIDAGRALLQEKQFDLHVLLDELEDSFSLMARQKGLHLDVVAAPDAPRHLLADAVKLRQVLTNLLGNAIKFTGHGSVTLQVGLVPGAPGRLAFTVTDTGVGIARDELELLGKPFVQAQAGRAAHEGTGLGLALSRAFVQLMGGALRLASEPGRGTTASFDIPVQAAQAPAVPETDGPARRVLALAPGQPRYRILAVDDVPESRQLLLRLLAPLGFDVREAANGEEALAVCASWQPHLIWMDMRMPVMDGREATRHIRASDAGKNTVIIALTASSYEEEREQILALGCDDFLRKPFRDAALFDLIQRHLGAAFVQEDAPASDAAIGALPAALRHQLAEALVLLDEPAIDANIATLRTHDAALAEALAAHAERFDYDSILALLDRAEASPAEAA